MFARVASPIPLAEDWLAVPPLTGHEPALAHWLWEQNNEHRMPIARLLLLGTVKAARGDFRAGGLLNLALLASAAAGLILFARRLRGHTDLGDAFFPLLLLHFGHSNQVLFAWQITFVLSIVLIVAAGCTLFAQGSVTRLPAAGTAGVILLLLPLCGFIGLLFVPSLGVFLFYAGLASRYGWRQWPRRPWIGLWLIASCVGSVAISVLYFVGYEHPWWNPPNPGISFSLKVGLKVLSLGFGPAAEFWWAPAVAGAVLLVSASLWQSVRRVMQQSGQARDHAIGGALFLATSTAFALVVGWGRAGYEPEFGIPIRYVVLVLPVFIATYLTWVAAASSAGVLVGRGLAGVMLVLLPLNTVAGHRYFADWYKEGTSRVLEDLRHGVSIEELAVRHQPFLVHWWTPAELARHMMMLEQARLPPFDRRLTTPR